MTEREKIKHKNYSGLFVLVLLPIHSPRLFICVPSPAMINGISCTVGAQRKAGGFEHTRTLLMLVSALKSYTVQPTRCSAGPARHLNAHTQHKRQPTSGSLER